MYAEGLYLHQVDFIKAYVYIAVADVFVILLLWPMLNQFFNFIKC